MKLEVIQHEGRMYRAIVDAFGYAIVTEDGCRKWMGNVRGLPTASVMPGVVRDQFVAALRVKGVLS